MKSCLELASVTACNFQIHDEAGLSLWGHYHSNTWALIHSTLVAHEFLHCLCLQPKHKQADYARLEGHRVPQTSGVSLQEMAASAVGAPHIQNVIFCLNPSIPQPQGSRCQRAWSALNH